MAGKEVSFDIVAKDKASAVLDDVADTAGRVEKLDPEIEVTADTGKADHTVDSFATQLDRLTDTDKVVVLALRAGQAQAELADLATDLATIDSTDPTLDVKFERYAEVSGQLDQLETQIKTLGTTGDADLAKVSSRLDGIGASSGQMQGAVHSMAGNAIGDFAATATGIGPLGEAFGQLTEAAANAEGGIKEMASAGAQMGLLAAAIYVVQKAMASIAATNAFHKAEVDAYKQSIKDTGDALGDLQSRLTDAGKVMASPSLTNASNWLGLSESVRDVTDDLVAAGLTVEGYSTLVAGSKEDVLAWGQAQKDAGTFTRDTVTAMDAIIQAQADVQAATDASTTSSAFFEGQQRATNAEAERWTGLARSYKTATDDAAGATDLMGRDVNKVEDALRRSSSALDTMRGNIDDDQMWLDLQDDFDNVRETGVKAWTDVGTKADGAEQSVRDHERALNDLKQGVIDYGTEVLGLPADQVVNIATTVDDAGLDETERRLAELKRQAEIKIKFIAGSGAGFLLTGSSGSASGTSSSSTLSRVAAPARWARVNGRRG